MATKTRRALPERYRLARNIEDGYEIRTDCSIHDQQEWMRVVSATEVLSPVGFMWLKIEPVDGPMDCFNKSEFTVDPTEDIWSRRPAGEPA